MTETNANSRIVKNTIILYIKLIVSIIINFVSARLVLQLLGVSDYGLYSVVGGIVAMLNILGTAMVATSYRYMAVEIGKGADGDPNRVYNTVFFVHIIIAVLLFVVGETFGLYYVKIFLNVTPDKIGDAAFVLHFSLITTVFTVLSIPAHGLIIAREKFVYTSIVAIITDVLKLLLIICLLFVDGNKLRLYASLLALIHLLTPIAYQVYCRIYDSRVVSWHFNKNGKDYKEVLYFAWWILIGAFASIAKTQGAALVINFFFGTMLNAAFGLATQVFNATSQFTTTIRQAAIPQIMKGHASGDEARSLGLVYKISKYSYLLMLIPGIPLIICVNGILKIWLGSPPEYTAIFMTLMLFNGMVANLAAGFDATIQATGKIRRNQIGYCIISISLVPIIYILYKFGAPPYANVIVMCFLTVATILFQCYIMKRVSSFDMKEYVKGTILPAFITLILTLLPLIPCFKYFNSSTSHTITGVIISFVWTIAVVFMFGLNYDERSMIVSFVKSKILKK